MRGMPDAFELERVNRELGHAPQALIDWALALEGKALVTTNFGPFAAVLPHLLTRTRPELPVLWIDTGYGTPATYQFADELTRLLKLDLHVYVPLRTRAHREAVDGPPPAIDDPRHAAFTREVKLEPFARATRALAPKVWFTAIRKEQTEYRAGLAPATFAAGGILRVSPVFHWSSKQMNDYLKQHHLPNNFDYEDPTKADAKRECGLHTAA